MNSPKSGPDPIAATSDSVSAHFSQFVTAVAAGNDEQTEALCQQLTTADEPCLIELTKAASLDARWWAIRALAQCGAASSIAPIFNTLSAPQPELRQVAALALGRIHQRVPEMVAKRLPELATLLADEDGTVRQAVVVALALCGDNAVAALAAILAGPHQGARTRATQALRRIGSMPAAVILYRYLEDPNHLVRTYAYEALDDMGLLENMLVTL